MTGAVPQALLAFLAEHRDSRAYRRGLAVKRALQGHSYATISEWLDVTPGFISQAKSAYESEGIDGLRLKYTGGHSYLSPEQRDATIAWLKQEQTWSVQRLRTHLESTYGVVYQSLQSYYDLLAAAGITYKKAQASNPERQAEQVAAKKKRFARA